MNNTNQGAQVAPTNSCGLPAGPEVPIPPQDYAEETQAIVDVVVADVLADAERFDVAASAYMGMQ